MKRAFVKKLLCALAVTCGLAAATAGVASAADGKAYSATACRYADGTMLWDINFETHGTGAFLKNVSTATSKLMCTAVHSVFGENGETTARVKLATLAVTYDSTKTYPVCTFFARDLFSNSSGIAQSSTRTNHGSYTTYRWENMTTPYWGTYGILCGIPAGQSVSGYYLEEE